MKLQLFIFFIFILIGCNAKEQCQYSPAPIFKAEWPTVSDYSFERNGPKAVEKITMENGVRLELFQTICNNTQQEYQFILQGDYRNQPDKFWINAAMDQFLNLAKLDRSVVAIGSWADQIKNLSTELVLGEKLDLDVNKYLMVDKLVGIEESKLLVTIGQIIE